MKKVLSIGAMVIVLSAVLTTLVSSSFAGPSVASAQSSSTPTEVSANRCINVLGGQATVPAGSTIVIRQGLAENTVGVLRNLLGAQTTIVSVNDAPMFDVSDEWAAPVQQPGGSWLSVLKVPTNVTLANPRDTMRFTFALVVSGKVPEVTGEPGQPAFNGPGLAFGGTCTVTAS